MFDLLAIDWGKKRIGMAFGNLETRLILPFDLDLNWFNFWEILEIQLKNRAIKKIILGMPVNFELGKTKTGVQIETFMEDLQEFLNEMFDTEFELETDLAESKKQGKLENLNKKNIPQNISNIQKTNLTNKREVQKYSKKPEIVIINERNSSQLSENFEIIQEKDSKSGFRKWQKINQKQNQKWEISKSNLNHLAASQILSWYLESL